VGAARVGDGVGKMRLVAYSVIDYRRVFSVGEVAAITAKEVVPIAVQPGKAPNDKGFRQVYRV
jgi:hypothetical protein